VQYFAFGYFSEISHVAPWINSLLLFIAAIELSHAFVNKAAVDGT
jgi:hypothetical protein